MNITGKTTVFTILAHPSSNVVAPLVYNELFRNLGLDMVYIAHDVSPDALPTTVRALSMWENLGGFNVTVPHKEAVAGFLDGKCPITSRIGVVNTVVRLSDNSLYGYNTDGIGALNALGDVKDLACLVMGVGGAGRSIIDALIHGGASTIYILNRSTDRAMKTIAMFGEEKVKLFSEDVLGDIDVVVQATSLADTMPFDLDMERLKKDARCLEIIMRKTVFYEKALSLGLEVIPGHRMLFGQTRQNFKLFTGIDISPEIIKNAFEHVGYTVG
ncbi:MAG: shikimate dehydrogenase [Deltaproteobacteria bacterium]|nr:shikimate dehydrogenase [Deltaproteobacteria bacterium]